MFGLSSTLLVGGLLLVGLVVVGGATLLERRRTDPEERPSASEQGEAWGEALATPLLWGGKALGALISAFGSILLRRSFGAKMYKKIAIGALYKYHKRSGGDAIGLNHKPSDQLDLLPTKYDQKLGETSESPGWQVKDGERTWEESAQGKSIGFIGRTPVVMLDDDADSIGSWLDARVTDAIDKGRMRELVRVDEGTFKAEITYPNGAGAGGQGPAMADGGANVWKDFEPAHTPIFEDMLIDVGSDEGFNGSAVSFSNYKDTDRDSTSQEKLKMAEERGRLMGMDPERLKSWMLKIFAIAAGLALAGLVGPELIGGMFGGGGGGGGSIIPFMLGAGAL
jgi:hypothetical protein